MIDISDAEKAIWAKSTKDVQITISFPDKNLTITNTDTIFESFELTERLETERALTFKGCNATMCKFSAIDLVVDVRGEHMIVSATADNGTAIPLFDGYVDSQSNLSHADVVTTVTAYDVMKQIVEADVTSWYNNLTFPTNIKAMRDSLCAYLNVQQSEKSLANDSLVVLKTITDSHISGGDILKAICQLNGAPAVIDRQGKIKYITLAEITRGTYPSTETYPSEETYPAEENAGLIISTDDYVDIQYEPFITDTITGVSIRNKEGVESGYYGVSRNNVLTVADNPLAWGINANLAAENLYLVAVAVKYCPSKITCQAYPYVEIGDIILMDTRLNAVRTYIFNRHLTGIQAMCDTYGSESDKSQPEYKQSVETAVSSNSQAISDESSRAQNAENTINSIVATKATIQQLNATNARVGNLEADHVSVGQLNATNAAINNLSAIAITTQNFSAQNINASKITAGTLSVNRLNGDSVANMVLDNCTGKSMTIYGLNVRQSLQLGSVAVYWMSKTVKDSNGNNITIQYLGR